MNEPLLKAGNNDNLGELIFNRFDVIVNLNRDTIFANKLDEEISEIFRKIGFRIWEITAQKILGGYLSDYQDPMVIASIDNTIEAELRLTEKSLNFSNIIRKEEKGSIKNTNINTRKKRIGQSEKVKMYINAFVKFFIQTSSYENTSRIIDENNPDYNNITKKTFVGNNSREKFGLKQLSKYTGLSLATWSRTIGKFSKKRIIFFGLVLLSLDEMLNSPSFTNLTLERKEALQELRMIIDERT